MPPACGLRGGGSGAGAALGRGAPGPSPSCGLQNRRQGSAPWGARICSGGSRSRNPRLAAGTRCQLTGTPEHGSPRHCASRKCHHHSLPSAASSSSSRRRLLHLPSSLSRKSQPNEPVSAFPSKPRAHKNPFSPSFLVPGAGEGWKGCGPVHLSNELLLVLQKLGDFGGVPARENSVVLKGGEGRRARYLLLLAWLPLPLIGADATGDGKQRAGGNIARRNSGSAALKAKAQSKNAPKRCPECRSLLLSLRGRLGRAARSAQGKNLSFF